MISLLLWSLVLLLFSILTDIFFLFRCSFRGQLAVFAVYQRPALLEYLYISMWRMSHYTTQSEFRYRAEDRGVCDTE